MQVQSLGWEDPLEEEMATYLFQYYCLEKPHGQRSMVGYSRGRKELDTTEHRCMCVHTHTHSPYKYYGFLPTPAPNRYVHMASVQFSCSVMSSSLRPYGLQHGQASLSITNSWSLPKLMSMESVMPSNHLIVCRPLLLLPQSFPASESFPMSQLFASGGQSVGVSASASVHPVNIQDLLPLGWTGWISL